MWKYNYSSELYHAWPKGYRRGRDGKPIGYTSIEEQKTSNGKNFRDGPTDKVQPKYEMVSVGNTSLQPIKKVQPKYGIVSVGNTSLQPITKVQPKYGIVSVRNTGLQKIQSTKKD